MATAANLGAIASPDGIEAARALLEVIAQHGPTARARDVLATDGVKSFKTPLADLLLAGDNSDGCSKRRIAEPIGRHPLRRGLFAFGLGLAFGHADAETLAQLAQTAKALGATGIRVAAERALLVIGLTEQTIPRLAADAERLAFVVRGHDPRLHVIACAGAPICASAHIAARALAPAIAAAAETYLDHRTRIHVSGCAKGCAHAGAASFSIVGRPDGCGIIANGSVGDAPLMLAPTNKLPAIIADLVREAKRETGHV
jgi:precorrin-3B synthase